VENSRQSPALIAGKQDLYIKLTLPQVLQQLTNVNDPDLDIAIGKDSFDVKVVNTQKARGWATALLAYNPLKLSGKIQEYGSGSRIDLQVSGVLTPVEIGCVIALCSAIGFLITAAFGVGHMFHFLLAICAVVVVPLAYICKRRSQEKKLRQFINSCFQPSLIEEKRSL
jgi:hypothetical protein